MANRIIIPFGILKSSIGSIDCLTFAKNGRILVSKSSRIEKRSRKKIPRDPAG